MKIWVCFWAYAPLHQWHLDVIMRAKKENDKCFVFVCWSDSDGWYGCWLPIRKRYRLVKKFFEDDESIIVVCLNETSLWLDGSWNDENLNIWLSSIYNQIWYYEISWEVTRYVSKNKYKEVLDKNIKKLWVVAWVVNNSTILQDSSQNLISSAQCRENPLRYRNKIAYTFRGNFSHNILILWTISEWKTTLIKDIAKYFWLVYSKEYVRVFIENNLKAVGDFTCKDFINILNWQYLLNRSQIDSYSNTWIFISDADDLVPLMHAKAFTTMKDSNNNKVFPLTKLEYETVLKPLTCALEKWIKWDKIFFLTPNSNVVDDGARYMLMAWMEWRQIKYKLLCELLEEFGLMDKVEFLKWWSYYENFCKVKDYIEWLYS